MNIPSSTNGNGSSKILWYILTLMTGLVLATIGSWASNTTRDVSDLTQRITAQEKLSVEINTKLTILLMQRQPSMKAQVTELP